MRSNDIGAAFVYQLCIYVSLCSITVGNRIWLHHFLTFINLNLCPSRFSFCFAVLLTLFGIAGNDIFFQ
ncbi:hypothetical protein Fmac_014120 [Flemingia macrophylla]|uniref:Uncharacterized protein n=1 Tax=Flemingia macrophylla TaxID=520843 RepID=A0ABD1MAT0_9FABA